MRRVFRFLKRWFGSIWGVAILVGVLGAPLAVLIGLIIETGVFREEAIEEGKYCYHYENGELEGFYGTYSLSAGYKNVAYEFLDKNIRSFIDDDEILKMRGGYQENVSVLEYSKDSVLARIRFQVESDQSGGMTWEVECYVPVSTLHDSPPPCHPNCE